MGRRQLNILHENFIRAGMVAANDPLVDSYPVTNLDERSANVVTRLDGDGSEASPLGIEFDLGEVRSIEAAVVCSSVRPYGSVILKGSSESYPPASWEWAIPLRSYPDNWLANGGSEIGTFSLAKPAFGVSDVTSWQVFGHGPSFPGTDFSVAKCRYGFPIAWHAGEVVTAPSTTHGFISRYFSRLEVADPITSVAGCFSLSPVLALIEGDVIVAKGRFRYPTHVGGLANINLGFADGALAVSQSVSLTLGAGDADPEWQEFELTLTVGAGDLGARYVAVYVAFSNANTPNFMDLDDCCVYHQSDGRLRRIYSETVETTGFHFAVLRENMRQVQSLRLEFVNDIAADGYVDVGRFLAGSLYGLDANAPFKTQSNLGHKIEVTSSGAPYLAALAGSRRRFAVETDAQARGQIEELRQLIERAGSDQVFASLFEETRSGRAILGAFDGALSVSEGPIADVATLGFDLLEER